MTEHNRNPVMQDQREKRLPATRLSSAQILYANNTLIKRYSDEKRLEDFLNKNVLGLNINGIRVLLINIDHVNIDPATYKVTTVPIDNITKSFITAPNTSLVGAEYFPPDLERHGLSTSKLYNYVHKRPALQARLDVAKELEGICSKAKKPVVVTDIANRPLYGGLLSAMRLSPFFVMEAAALNDNLAMTSFLLAIASASISITIQEKLGKGIFNPNKLSRFERIMIDLEQARRLFVAKGLEQITQDLYNSQTDPQKRQMVLLYPRAHGIRIADILEYPKPIRDTLRGLFYKGITPLLDYSVRRYEPDRSWRNFSTLPGTWNLVANQKIKLLS